MRAKWTGRIIPTQARLTFPSVRPIPLHAGDRHLDGRLHGLYLRRAARVHADQLLVAQGQEGTHHQQQVTIMVTTVSE